MPLRVPLRANPESMQISRELWLHGYDAVGGKDVGGQAVGGQAVGGKAVGGKDVGGKAVGGKPPRDLNTISIRSPPDIQL